MAIKVTRRVSSSIASTTPPSRPSPYVRPQRPQGQQKMLIKRLPNLQNGRLESVLLPVLASNLVMGRERAMGEEKSDKKTILKREQEVTIKKEWGFDNGLVFVKEEKPEYEEYAGSTDDDEGNEDVVPKGPRGINKPQQQSAPKKVVDLEGTKVFIKTLLHALDCRGCEAMACQKMRLVLGHFLSCSRHRPQSHSHCALCNQLIGIVVQHGKHLCEASKTGKPCPVPMCDAIREQQLKRDVKKEPAEEADPDSASVMI